jgi:hypothetical protein
MPAGDIEGLLRDGRPDWEAISFDVTCPRCGYNLRMLTRARCPECGLELDWRRSLERALSGWDLLFEHHWRRRPVAAWAATLAATFQPARFWRRVSLYDEPRVWPLIFMVLSGVCISLLAMHLLAYGSAWVGAKLQGISLPRQAWYLSWQAPKLHAPYRLAVWPLTGDWRYLYLPGGLVCMVAGVWGLLATMRQTLGRCRVRGVQLLRVVAYSLTPVSAFWMAAALAMAWTPPSPRRLGMVRLIPHDAAAAGAGVLLAAVLAGYLGVGLRDYLKLPRPWLVALTTAAVAVLFAYTVLLSLGLLLGGGWE